MSAQTPVDAPNVTTGGLRDQLLAERYLLKNTKGKVVETDDELFRRVAETIVAVSHRCQTPVTEAPLTVESCLHLMASGTFLPNTPTLMGAGRKNGMLSACFVLPVGDSIPEIFRAVSYAALVQKAGGGTGFAFDRLRPTGDLVASSGGKTSGPISFMRVFAEATQAIQQGAFRRGANMGMMSVDHPDILSFITLKQDLSALSNFNLSVKVTDGFMERLNTNAGALHVVVNPRTGDRCALPKSIKLPGYSLQDMVPADGAGKECFTVGDVWNMIVRSAWASGEPGLCFIDSVNQHNPTPQLGPVRATNPCGEQPLLDYEACNLGSINVSRFVEPDRADLDWNRLATVVAQAVEFLDNVIDANCYPLEETRKLSLANRKIGLGVMGFADALVLLGMRYDSEEAVRFAGRLSAFLTEEAHMASEALASARGSFPNWEGSVWETVHHRPMRNATCTTIAPTGSISIIARCSSGIEPIFSFAGSRRALDGKEFVYIHPMLDELGRRQGWMTEAVAAALLEGTPATDIAGIPPGIASCLVTAHEVAPEYHVRMQAAFQKHIDNAVSKTVNLPAGADVEDVDSVFRRAYDLGCKGITVYRDGSRAGQTLTAAKPAEAPTLAVPRRRPRATVGSTTKFRMGCGTLFVTVNRDERGLAEVFANLGRAGGCPSQSEATCRALSVALRSGVDPRELVDQLRGIRCLSTCVARKDNGEVDVLSCPDAIARALEEAIGETDLAGTQIGVPAGRTCPFCKHVLRREAGCFVCDQCGFNSCG